jgi:hypothetical protein
VGDRLVLPNIAQALARRTYTMKQHRSNLALQSTISSQGQFELKLEAISRHGREIPGQDGRLKSSTFYQPKVCLDRFEPKFFSGFCRLATLLRLDVSTVALFFHTRLTL